MSNDNIYKDVRFHECMANALISVRVSDGLLEDINELTASQGYSTVQEFLRAAAREKVQKERLASATITLQKLYGSAKGEQIHHLTAKERDVLARSLRK
jgi:Arc/MetJ-type ribon-helix-helix transcriptional regulator